MIYYLLIVILLLCCSNFVINSKNVFLNENNESFASKPIIAIILPITSKRNKIDTNNPDPSQLLLMNYFYPSFLSTIEPLLYTYRIYLAYAKDDKYLSNNIFLSKLKHQMENKSFTVFFV